MNTSTTKVVTAALLSAPVFVFAQTFQTEYPLGLVNGIIAVFSAAFPLLLAVAVLYVVWGVVLFIGKAGDEKARTEGKQRMVWGIASIFIIVSVWGLVAVLQGVLRFGGDTPSSYSPQAYFGDVPHCCRFPDAPECIAAPIPPECP